MMRATFLILGLLLGFPAVANPTFGAKAPESRVATKTSVPPGIRPENQVRLCRWVLDRMTFADANYSEGMRARVVLTFMLDRRARMSELAIRNSTDSTLANQALAVLAKATPEVFEQENCKPTKGPVVLYMELLLVRGSDGALHAMDNIIYATTDQQPVFMGQGARFFRKWAREQVETRLGIDTTRKSVPIGFVIEMDGSVSNLKLPKTVDSTVANAIVQVMESAPRFTPGMKDGLVVRRWAKQNISFQPGEEDADEVYWIPQVGPKFLGAGIELFRLWVKSSLKCPVGLGNRNSDGVVLVSFIIEIDGSLTDMQIIKSTHPLLSEAVLELLATSPKWTPGISDGEAVRMSMQLPVIFRSGVVDTPPFSRLNEGSDSRF